MAENFPQLMSNINPACKKFIEPQAGPIQVTLQDTLTCRKS